MLETPNHGIRQYLRPTDMAAQPENASLKQSKKRPLADKSVSLKQSATKKRKSKASGLTSGHTTDDLDPDTFNLESYNDGFKAQKDRTSVSRRVKKEQENNASDKRPGPRGRPPVYAEYRSDLAETLDYYRQRQGGNQTNDGHLKGSLLSIDHCPRQLIADEIILTRAGGGMSMIDEGKSRKSTQIKDQNSECSLVRAFQKNQEDQTPTIFIVSDKANQFPTKALHPYSVMAHFVPISMWHERNNDLVIVRFRYQKMYLDEAAWWVPRGSPKRTAPVDYVTKAERFTCDSCEQEHPVIYDQGHICFNQECDAFWKLNKKLITDTKDLTFNQVWLDERVEWNVEIDPPYDLVPDPLPPNLEGNPWYAAKASAYKGMVCPKCRTCIPRVRMDGWVCETQGCDFLYPMPILPFTIRMVEESHGTRFQGPAFPVHLVLKPPMHRRQATFNDPWRIETFDVQGIAGCFIKQFHSNESVNRRPGGPDDILARMSDKALGLERRAMDKSFTDGQLTDHFSNNFVSHAPALAICSLTMCEGMPYTYSATNDVVPFDKSPELIIDSVYKMSWIGQNAMENTSLMPINEVLALGYLQGQHIGYHDDGEVELGPTIVTLSLGCEGIMQIRMQKKFYVGSTGNNSNIYNPKQRIVEGCYNPDLRREMNANWSSWTQARKDEKFKELKQGAGTHAPVCLNTKLRHGDYIVMHGSALQKYYEHTIHSNGDIRFALTGRHVKPDMITDPVLRKGGEFDWQPEREYDGDVSLNAQIRASKRQVRLLQNAELEFQDGE
ncbi:MAG: hypothetical protein Q9174_002827 [Haloplaca sp. 1 TL-2023]